MALKLVIKNSFLYKTNSGGELEKTSCDITLDTTSLTATLDFKNSAKALTSYTLSLVGLSFRKKMYQPTEVVASVQIVAAAGYTWCSIAKKDVEEMFVKKQVSLYDNNGVTVKDGEDVIPDKNVVGLDFYVLEVQPCYKADSMVVTLKIYSPDKELTLKKDCQTFVSKKLGAGILNDIMPSMPYGSSKIDYNYEKMKVLAYLGADKKVKEHIFPFLVQYNESIYDMLARTCNRWGEFLFYENRKLNIGYSFNDTSKSDNSSNETTALTDLGFNSYTYIDLDEHTIGDNYNRSANYDTNIINNPYQKSPYKVEGLFFSPGEKWDIMLVKKFASFLKNDKNLPTFFANELIDDLFALASKSSTVAINNSEFDNTYFESNTTDTDPTQFGKYKIKDDEEELDGFNPFSEISSKFVDKLYKKILTNEQNASKGAVSIDFDTTFPHLWLGDVIGIDSARFIVVQIDCKTVYVGETASYVYQVIATPQDSEKVTICIYDENDKDTKEKAKPKEKEVALFYPTILPTGHIRTADPQMATVTDANDPLGNGRVRVMFTWQTIEKEKETDKIKDETKKASSPWIQYTANAGGQKGIMGMHYEGDEVLVGFVDGNVERPYVLGAVSKGAGADIHCATPGGHVLKINDDPAGFSKFFTGMFMPGWSTMSAFLPQMSKFPEGDNALKMAGGFELTDNYGFYKISGSSDGRNVSVASPWGDVRVSAFTGITISAPNGDIRISGKNVSIEAGNNLSLVSGKNVNYKLWREKKTALGELQYVLIDVAAAVAKKLMEKFITIVDLSIIRSAVEIVFRPVEGSLTVKSNRYLKLEAGKNECSYPAEAYSDYRKESSYLKFEDKWNAKRSAGFYSIHNSDMGSSMVEIFHKIIPMVEALDQKYKASYNRCVDLKGQLEGKMISLSFFVNSANKPYNAIDFNALYESLKDDLWKEGKFEPLKEDKLQFTDEVKIDGDLATIVTDYCVSHVNHYFGAIPKEEVRKTIVDRRKKLRKEALETLNELRKEICNLLNLEFDASDINKKLSWFLGSAAPKDFKKKMNASFSRGKCKESRYYKFEANDDRKALDVEILPANKALTDQDRKYLRRVVALNLLDEFGFCHDDLRKKKNPADPALPPVPQTDATAPAAVNILDDNCWKDFINSLNGVPSLERDKTLLAGGFESAIGDAWDKINFWEGAVEKFSWGQGKNGQILFGAEGKTYALKNSVMNPVTPMSPTYTSLLEDNADLSTKDRQLVKDFLEKIKNELNSNF